MKNSSSPYVVTVDPAIGKKILADLESQGFEISKIPHAIFSAKRAGLSCTLFESGKLVIQGKNSSEFIEFYLEPEILKKTSLTYPFIDIDTTPRIGIDESGKGDVFGPLCIAGVFASEKDFQKLAEMGVKDSKMLTDKSIQKLAKEIAGGFSHHVVKINPLKYNELYEKFGNLNFLLAWGHATAIEQLVSNTGCRNVIIDQFAHENVVCSALARKRLNLNLTQVHKGEEDLTVAAASILARSAFLDGLEELGKKYDLILPKGASVKTIETGKKMISRFGKEALQNVAKLHFKTVKTILGEES